ncbi:response regulator [Tengunoibacter tsumagoiensis]|uniref:Response regulatory domain-containing protein n=1 Tax=Tengunoibacter tsumagoiensis TaxID=2014871 RepID=A0A402A2X4_9CHLR|nr:response regulator [Tengunoibacter tsumagoiensis]GCE13396.1 hypothetical protein KTT_32550 [Tengunoibacter tsumagoiensis]
MSEVWRIFVVEGDESLNRSIVNSLHKDGYAVQGVTNGADAVRVLWMEEYDVVICDLKTPGTDGFELLQWLRSYRPNTRMILIGSIDMPALRVQALESGAASYLEHPLDVRLLKEELRRLLQQSGFSASLDSFDLLDVIQIITMSRKSITLLLNTGLEERGVLRFHNGELTWAEYGVLRGEEAFFALAAHKNGTVTQQDWDDGQRGSNVTQPLSRLIFQALQYRTKYADRLQYSGELNAIQQMQAGAPELPAFPQMQSGEQKLNLFSNIGTSGDEIDDSPFVFVEGPQTPVQPVQPPIERAFPTQIEKRQETLQPTPHNFEIAGADKGDTREWWERTSQIVSVNKSSGVEHGSATTPAQYFDEQARQSGIRPLGDQNLSQSELPSWLTDKAISSGMPAVRPSSLANGEVAQPPKPEGRSSAPEWPQSIAQSKTPPPVQANAPVKESGPLQPVPPNWLTTPIEQARPATPAAQPPLNAAPTSGPLSYPDLQDSNPMLTSATLTAQRAARRNYTALVSALQTLGYSIAGFIAAAVVSSDGQPIAQVAVDDLDVARICKPFSTIQKHILMVLEQSEWGEYQDTIISSADAHILMRQVGVEKKAFQVLITTREANPIESLEVMANVEGAISAALRQ